MEHPQHALQLGCADTRIAQLVSSDAVCVLMMLLTCIVDLVLRLSFMHACMLCYTAWLLKV